MSGVVISDEMVRLFDLRHPEEVRKHFKLGRLEFTKYSRAYAERRGLPTCHHPEKAQQVHELLRGRSGLKIYESCAYLGTTGQLGYLNQAYQAYGEVTARGPQDGGMVAVTRREVRSGAQYDVVDLDPYSAVFTLLEAGAVQLVRPGGLLICTWPQSGLQKLTSVKCYGYHGCPGIVDFVHRQGEYVRQAGRSWSLPGTPAKFGSIWRIPMVLQ